MPRVLRAQGLVALTWWRFVLCWYSNKGARGFAVSWSHPQTEWHAFPGHIAALRRTVTLKARFD